MTSSTHTGNVAVAINTISLLVALSKISSYVTECLKASTTHPHTSLTCSGHITWVNGTWFFSTWSAHPFIYPKMKLDGYQYGVVPSGCANNNVGAKHSIKINLFKQPSVLWFSY